MADIKILTDNCDDEQHGDRGRRGRRGRRGPTGPTGPSSGGDGAQSRQIFTTDDTYVPTPGTTRVEVMMAGGGGAGGGSLGQVSGVSVGGGGGAGAALDFFIDSGGVPITGGPVIIGAGGVGALGAAGGAGGFTTVTINGTVYSAAPGNGGGTAASDSFTPTAATVAGGNTLNLSSVVDVVSGECGTPGVAVSLARGQGGTGAGGEFGIGGDGTDVLGGLDGGTASGFGAGGGGSGSTTTSQTGGAGAPGIVIIDEFA